MQIHNYRRGAHAVMGNNSSQLGPTSPGPRAQENKSSHQSSVRGKRKQHQSISEGHQEDEEKVGSVMLYNGSRHPTSSSFDDDDAAAASQLLAESYPMQDMALPSNFNDPVYQTSGSGSRKKKNGGKKSKQRMSVLGASLDTGNIQPGVYDLSPDIPSKDIATGGENDSGMPPSIHGLDVVDENDERLSSLFQEYESHAGQSNFVLDEPSEHNAHDLMYFTQDPTGATLDNQSTPAIIAEFDQSKKRKRQHRSYSDSEDSHISAQELLNETGQHASDELDFEAFDQIFANEDTHLANPFNDESGCERTHATELSFDENPFVPQAQDHSPAQSDTHVVQVARPPGQLDAIASTSRRNKRRRMEVPNSLDSQLPVYASTYAANEGQQDRVLQGLEDRQVRSSSEIPYSQPPGLSHGTSYTSAETQRKESPPLRLANPSKRRGNKKQRGGQKSKTYKPPLQELSEKGGIFRDDEIAVLENFRDRYCEQEEMSKHRFNELVQSGVRKNVEAHRLFSVMYEEMPYRTRQSVIRFSRRHFHNYAARGAWTQADDEHLRDAVAKKGTSWKAVGALIDRFPEDCRDRYRNYLINSEKRNTESWRHEEIRNLVKAVDDCMRLLQEERRRKKEEDNEGRDIPVSESESDQEVKDMKLVNWQIVSERMGGTRSRLQCAYKFNRLKQADKDYYFQVVRRLREGKGFKSKADSQASRSWRLRRSLRKLRNMRAGDKYDFLQLFADCPAAAESNISWKSLGSKAFRERWTNMDMKAALEIFKTEVPRSDGMNYQDVVNRVYTKLMAESPNGFDDRWDPDVHGDINEMEKADSRRAEHVQASSSGGSRKTQRRAGKKKKKKPEYRPSARYTKIKSEAVVSSDEEEEVEKDRGNEDVEDAEEGNHEPKAPTPDEPFEADMHREGSPEIAESAEEGDTGQEQTSRTHSASGREDTNDGHLGTSMSNPDMQTSESDSESESDNSLFNAGSESELVDRLQLLRDT
ncbi:MAG: hypothetical protein Q9182_003796 [Xanthomendoza sp. 2 TL-2023]